MPKNAWSATRSINNHCLSILKAPRLYATSGLRKSLIIISTGLLICGIILVQFAITDFSIALCPAYAYGTSCDHSAGFITFTVGILMILVSIGLFAVALERGELGLKKHP
jgi:hypothetical protein